MAKENIANHASANEFRDEAGYKLLPVDRLLMRIAFILFFLRLYEIQTNLSRKCTRFSRYVYHHKSMIVGFTDNTVF